MTEEIEKFRDGIFAMNTRRFGKVAELMIQKIYGLNDSDNLAYDLKAIKGEKIEVKFSTVLKKCNSNINSKNLIDSVIASNIDNRMLTFEKAKKSSFDCNIQQVKIKEFDYLYYGCFFEDKVMICKIESSKIVTDRKILYSNKQHRGNVGEGQFHINNMTIQNHLENYLDRWLNYEELYDMFKEQKRHD